MNLMFPNILRLAMYLLSSSNSLLAVDFSYSAAIWTRFSNSSLHFLSKRRLKVQALLAGGSKLGAFSTRNLHNCAYIDEYLGSSRAFSKIRTITPFNKVEESRPTLKTSLINFSNFSGVNLLRIPRTFLKMAL